MLYWSDFYFDQEKEINFISHRIQPFVEFRMPDGKWVSYSLGIFLLSSPNRQENGFQVYRDIEAYDGLFILEQDRFTERYTVKAGTRYTDAIIGILESAGITKYNIEQHEAVLPNDVEYEPGIEKLKPISDFLAAINYTPLWVDDYGYYTASRYISPQERSEDYSYLDDDISVVLNGMEESLDLGSVANKWTVIYTNPDSMETADPDLPESSTEFSLSSTYVNDSPASPTSTYNRGFTIVDFRKIENIAGQSALDEYVKRLAFESSQIFAKVRFKTAIMPIHSFQDVLFLRNRTLGLEGKYAETSWKIPLQVGGEMEHEARKVVNI